MKVTYEAQKSRFQLLWKNHVAAQQGAKYPYSRIYKPWKGKKAPSKTVLASLTKQYLAICEEEERKSKELADFITKAQKGDENGVINAANYFLTLPDSELCENAEAVTLNVARNVAKEFGQFLHSKYPDLYLHDVREQHLDAYFTRFKDLTYETLDRRRMRINYFFNRVMKKNKASTLPYCNPCEDYNLERIRGNISVARKERFSVSQMRALLEETKTAKGYTREIYRKQLYAMVYFHSVTGWRTTDITGLKWSEIDLENRLITKEHAKTKRDGTRTKLYITDIMMDILVSLREMCKGDKMNIDPDYVFPLRKRGGSPKGGMAHSGYVMIKAYMDQFRKKHGLTKTVKHGIKNLNPYCVHSWRDSVIQELSVTDSNTEKINYLVGHSTGSINSTNYLRFEVEAMRATKSLVEHMEKVIGAEFWNESARIAHEKAKQQERLDKMRKNMSITEGGFMLDIDPYTGQRVQIAL